MEEIRDVYKCDVVIIGAGVIGLAIAACLSAEYEDVLLIEKEKSSGQHTSSRNSEVIHSGIYYPSDSLKAKLCVKGNFLLYEFLKKHNIPHKKCGKLIVACSKEEEKVLEDLQSKAINNGVLEVRLISAAQIKEYEPNIKASKALLVESTGIVDTHSLMKKFEQICIDNEVVISYNTEINDINFKNEFYELTTTHNDVIVKASIVVNAAGLWSDQIAKMVGLQKCQLYWCKGEYYKTTRYKKMKKLVYPVPDPAGKYLGIHTVIDLDGNLSFGPNAYYVDELNYDLDETHKQQFYEAINRYLEVDYEDLQPSMTGIRPKAQSPDASFADFLIKNEAQSGYNNFINLVGIESPGLTSCLAIANYVKEIIN